MKKSAFVVMALTCISVHAVTNYQVTVNSDSVLSPAVGSLRQAMLNAIANTTDQVITITFDNNLGLITLAGHLPVLSTLGNAAATITVDGGTGNTINGGSAFQAFFVTPIVNNGTVATGTLNATIKNLTLSGCSVTGGAGGAAGGGGAMGAGGAIFVDVNATVTAQNVTFSSCSAIGGATSAHVLPSMSAGGGGARGGAGGADFSTGVNSGGGGGFASSGGTTTGSGTTGAAAGGGGANIRPGSGVTSNGGNYVLNSGATGGGGGAIGGNGASSSSGGAGGSGGGIGGSGGSANGGSGGYGGGGAGSSTTGGSGGWGGGGGGSTAANAAGNGGDFGGGAGSASGAAGSVPGAGGYGGGGGATNATGTAGGAGGFGGGGGASRQSSGGISAYAGGTGGSGSNKAGGGGAGLGGALFCRNGGALTFDGCAFSGNSVTGGTAGSGGTNGSAFGTDLFLQNGTTLTVSGDTTLTGTLHSDGSWTKAGAAVLTLSGTNTYSGTTSLSAGTIALGANAGLGTGTLSMASGTTLALNNTISASNTITFNGTNTVSVSSGTGTLSGTFSGAGGNLVKNGGGKLLISGSNPAFTGAVEVAAGELKVNGSLGSSITVDSGGTLTGTGSVGGITNSGTLAPGNSIGTLSSGTVVFTSGSFYEVQFDATSATLLDVTGTATLDGTLQLIQIGNTIKGQYLIIRTTGGISGSFASIASGLSGLKASVEKIGNDLFLIYGYVIPLTGLSGNALSVANYLNANASISVLNMINGLSGNTLKKALDSLSPSRNAFPTYIAAQTAFSLSKLLTTHLNSFRISRSCDQEEEEFFPWLTEDDTDECEETEKGFTAWVSGYGELSRQEASLQNPSFHFGSAAVLIGLDFCRENKNVVGSSLGYARTLYHEGGGAGHGDINYYFGSVYANGFLGSLYFSPAIWGIFNEAQNTRHISFPGFSESAYADILAWQFIPHLEIGYDVEFSWGDLLPFASMDWALSWQRKYQEKGASPFNAEQKAHRSSVVRAEAGLHFCETWEHAYGALFLREKISYVFENPFDVGTVHTAFVGMPGAFTVVALQQKLDLAAIGLNFLIEFGKENPVKIDLGYEGEFGFNYLTNELTLNISKSF